MKKHFTKLVAAVLCLLMLLTIAPTAEFAGTLFKAFAEDTYKTAVKVYSDAKIVEHTTQYRSGARYTTTSTNTSLNGWSRDVGENWVKSGNVQSLEHVKAWPSGSTTTVGFCTSSKLYTDYNKSVPTSTSTEKYETVGSDETTGYLYWHWCYTHDVGSVIDCKVSDRKGTKIGDHYTNNFHAFRVNQSLPWRDLGSLSCYEDTTHNSSRCKYTYWWNGLKPNVQGNIVVVKTKYQKYIKSYNYYKIENWTDWRFAPASSLAEIGVEEGENVSLITESRPVAVDEYGVVYSENLTKIYSVPAELQTECFNVPATVTEICDAAFYNCAGIKEVVIPASVTIIDANAFNNCTALESIIIPEKVVSIGSGAFANCFALGSVFFKAEAPITLGTDCFTYTAIDCFYVYFLEFKDAWLPYESSWNGYPLKGYNPPGERYSNIDANGTDSQGFTYSLNASNKTATITAYSGGANVVFPKRVIKDSVEYSVNAFATNAFKGKTNITKVSMSKKITSIPANAFDGCTGLTEISYNGSFNSIGEYAFRNCSNLKYFSYLKGLTSIAKGAFYNCSKLIDISIPSGVKTIGESAFYGCAKIGNLVIPSSVTSIGASAFYGCKGMSKVTFEGVPSIGATSFANCTALTTAKFKGNPPSTVGSGAFGGSTFGVEYPSNNNAWKSAVSNYKWKGYNAFPSDIVSRVGTNAYILYVISPKGKALPDATVKLGNQTSQTTDSNGRVLFTKPSSNSVSLVVTPKESDYKKLELSNYSVSKTPVDTVKLSYSAGSVFGVKFNGIDIKKGKAEINANYTDEKSTLTVTTDTPQKITKLEILSGNTVIESKKNLDSGRHNVNFSIYNPKFAIGKKVTAKMTLADGQTTKSTLNIVPFMGSASEFEIGGTKKDDTNPNQADQEIDLSSCRLSLFKSVKLKFPSNNKLFKHITISSKNSATTYVIGLNCTADKDFKEKYILKQLANRTDRLLDNKLTKNISGGICGEVEVGFNPNTEMYYLKQACVYVYIELKISSGVTLTFTIPVRIELEFKGKVTAKITWENDLSKSKITLKYKDLSFTIDISLKASAGVGGKLASAGIYGKYALQLLVPKPIYIYGNGEFGLYVKAIGFKYEHTLFKSKKELLYSNTKKAKAAPAEGYLADMYDPAKLTPIDRDYLDTRSDWLSGASQRKLAKALAGGIENTANLVTLQANAYDYVEPKIITCNGTTMMVYADDIATRSQGDMQALVYSIYNPTTGLWSAPQKIDNNDTFDNNFELYSSGKDIYVIYSEANKTFGNNPVLEETTAAMDISVAKYDTVTGRFVKIESINHDVCYDMTPAFCVVDGTPTAVWVRNTNNSVYAMDNSNEIVYSNYVNDTWTEPSTLVAKMPLVTSIAIGKLGDKSYVAATSDADNDPDTQDDNKLILADLNGAIKEIETGINNNANVQFVSFKDENTLIWSNSGQVLKLTSASNDPTSLVASEGIAIDPNFGWVDCNNGKYAITYVSTSEEDKGSNVYTLYYDGTEWTEPIRVTKTDRYVGAYDVTYVNNKFVIPYRDTQVTFSDTEETFSTSANLCAAYISPVSDLYVTGALVDRESLALGEDANMTLSIFNNGFTDVENARIAMKNANGDTVFTTTEAVSIASGDTADCDVTFTAPAAVEEGLYQITVENASGANTSPLRTYELDLWQSDLCVEAEQLIVGEENSLLVNVTNKGFAPSSVAQLKIANGIYSSDAEAFVTEDIAAIEPGVTESFIIELNDDIYTDDETSGIVTAWVTTEGIDAVESNDYSTVSIVRFEEDEGYDEDEVVKFAPDLSADTISVDLVAPQTAQIVIEGNGNAFSGVKNLTEGTQYTYTEDTLTFKQSYLSGLEQGIHEVELVFNEGLDNEYTAPVIISVTDSTIIPISGFVKVEGEAVYGNSLEVNTDSIEPENAEYKIEWKRDGNVVSTDSTYTIQAEDIGKNLTASFLGENGFGSVITSGSVVPAKAVGATLLSPVEVEANYTSISLVPYEGYEYKCNDGSWTTNPVFDDLTPNTEYGFYVRKAETSTHLAGESSDVVTISTKPVPLDAEIVIDGTPERGKTLTAIIVKPGTATYSYQWYRNGSAIQGATSNTYTTTAADANCQIKVEAIASGTSVGKIMSDPVTIICNHEYKWVTTKQPTCEGKGEETGACVCGHTEKRELSPLGHTSPDSNGKCSRCGKVINPPLNVCKWCGKQHNGFFQKIIGFFHNIFAAIFGARY